MELVSYDLKSRESEPVLIMPIGDIQWSGKRGDTTLQLLKDHLEWGMDHNAYFIGMGDYIDFCSPSNRQRLTAAALYDSANDVIDDKALELTEEIYSEALKPTKGRWLGLLEGHHFLQLKSGMTTDMRLCQMLDTKFLGTSAMIRLGFRRTSHTNNHVTIWCHHGAGSGNRAGSPLNKLDQLPAYFDADIFLMGHTTKKVAAPMNRIVPVWKAKGGPVLNHKTIILANTGGFSRGYQSERKDGSVPRGNYVEQKMLTPAALGGVKIRIVPKWSTQTRSWAPQISVEL